MLTFFDRDLLRGLASREEGQTMAEYGVTLAVVTVTLLAVFTALSTGVQSAVSRVFGFLPS